jgi:hypothetical protein
MKRNRHAPAVGMTVMLVGAGLAIKDKAVSNKSRDKFSGGKRAELAIVNGHGLDRDSDLRLRGYLHLVCWRLRNWFSMLNEAFHHHFYDLFNVL